MFEVFDKEEDAEGEGAADVSEVEEIKDVVFGQPEGYGDCFKYEKHQKRCGVFFYFFGEALFVFHFFDLCNYYKG